jgi:hypothetical protein
LHYWVLDDNYAALIILPLIDFFDCHPGGIDQCSHHATIDADRDKLRLLLGLSIRVRVGESAWQKSSEYIA